MGPVTAGLGKKHGNIMQQLKNWRLDGDKLFLTGDIPAEDTFQSLFKSLCAGINAHITQWYEGADRLQCHFRVSSDEFHLFVEYLCDACWIEPLHSDNVTSLTKLHKTLQQNGLLTQSKHT